jgi:DNA (cytosine-5)-methyltransferase 1
MKPLGDITKINGAEIEPVHCIIGGSPCQDLSIAGKRVGLSGERSGLFMEQVRIVKEMREKYGTAYPRFVVWENVPGAFSSNKGADFAAVLTEIIRIVEPEAPCVDVPAKGWSTWGGFRDMGGRWSVAWRVHDAQYWGVPQRRRRIALVADFGGIAASEILFECKSVSGDIAESGASGQGFAEATEAGASYAVRIRGGCDGGGKGALVQTEKSGTLGANNDQTIFQPKAYGISAFESNAMRSANPHSGVYEANTSRTLDLNGGNPACNQGGICVVEPVGADLYNATLTGDTAATVTTGTGRSGAASGPLVLEPCGWDGGQVSPTLTKQNAGGNQRMPDKDNFNCVLTYSQQRFGEYAPAVAAAALRAAGGDYGGGSENLVSARYVVRRLTPLECERLQGFPDGWTDIGDYTDSKGKKRKTSDSARYKALGNSIALPFWAWMLRRMCEISGARTMGSLFDGIGGFPLCWERINGDGSCRWASEIEEFPIAVTKRHFKEE